MQIAPQDPIGVVVTGIDLAAGPDDEQVTELRTLLAEHGVAVIPGQGGLDDDAVAALLRRLGDAHPPTRTALQAGTSPGSGGETLFTDQYRAYETLPGDLRAYLAGRTITHEVGGRRAGDEHPVFRRHPISGRTALYLSTPERCIAVSGMDPGSSRTTVAHLHDHSTAEDNVLRHTWSPGEVVVWDDGCVLHRADHGGAEGDRVRHRGTVVAPTP